MGRRVLQVELFSGPRTIIQWSRFYSSADYQLPLQTSPDQAPVIRDPTAPMVNVAASLLSWGPFRKEFARWGRQAELFHPDDYPEYSSGGSRSTTAAHGGGGGRRPNFGNTTLNSDQIQNTTFSDHSSFSDDMTSRLKNNDRFGAELATDNAPIIEAPDGTSTPRSGPSPNNAPMSHKGRGFYLNSLL
ncbi:Oidioi.mRNA.OKI2018_I69.chr1.g2112.t1.cds [Oikopleura dioica]|uniref:Oidioi.mRNA.OKI2018_I69.chr1.g2112.t1.cds n=1 Tax=Oikopleura dioica TaxID=34765 RepID=A0ABN7SX00_OIKDI|nr:Oidioi.mRNA.OKI2018_I69.chr1.g2112.t1.cds [Oikopleura dioica]